MSEELELDPTDYHLRLLIEQMQRDGRSEDAIESAVQDASRRERPSRCRERETAGQRR